MRYKLAVIMGIAALAVSLAGCGETGNHNSNANLAANANRAANVNATVTPTPRRQLTREDYDRDKDRYQREAKESGRTIGSGLNDGWLWVKTRFDLAAEDDLRDSTINVDVENDVVTLSGTVATAEQKARAEQVAKAVEGVKSVRNQLKVSASGDTNRNSD